MNGRGDWEWTAPDHAAPGASTSAVGAVGLSKRLRSPSNDRRLWLALRQGA